MTSDRSPRVAVLTATLFDQQLHVWRACRQAGVDISLVGTDFNPYQGEWPWQSQVPDDVPTVVLRPLRIRPRKGHHWWIYPGLRRALRELQLDVVHVRFEPWTPMTLHVLLLRATGQIRAKVVVHGDEFTFWNGHSPKRVLRRAVLRTVFARLDGYACLNSKGANLARTHGLRRGAPATALSAIVPDLKRFTPASASDRRLLRKKLGLPLNKVVVSYIGRLEPEKGILDLLAAASLVDTSDFFLAVWGRGSLQGRVDASLAESDGVLGRFFGPLEMAQVAEAMQASDVVVVPSRAGCNEQFGRVAVEAMACSCAVLATRSGALGEVVADGGMLVEADNVDALANALRGLVSDPNLRGALGARGRERALRRFAPAAVAQETIRFWSAAMAE